MDEYNRKSLSFDEKLAAFRYTVKEDYEAGIIKKHEARYMMNNMPLLTNP